MDREKLLKVPAKISQVKQRGWGQARITSGTHKDELVAVLPKNVLGLTLKAGDAVQCLVTRNARRGSSERWFAVSTHRDTASSKVWKPWQVGRIDLPNTKPGASHNNNGHGSWGLACWTCGHAQVDATQVHQIKNSAVWTNTDQLSGTIVDPAKQRNEFKKCTTQSVLCSQCKTSLGSLYTKPFYDSETGTLTTSKVFPCVKLTTMWNRRGGDRCAMVITGRSESNVRDTLAMIPGVEDEVVYNQFGRLDAVSKRLIKVASAAAAAKKPVGVAVKLPSNETVRTEVDCDASVAALKRSLVAASGLEVADQRLLFAGRVLQDADKLTDYGVTSGTVVHLLRRQPEAAQARGASKEVEEEIPGGQGVPVGRQREILMGATFRDISSARILASGCNGAVFHVGIRKMPAALKVMFNYGLESEVATEQYANEYHFLRHVPAHDNIVKFLCVMPTSPLPELLAHLLPEETRELVAVRNYRTNELRYRSTPGFLLEHLPRTLEHFVKDQGEGMTPELAANVALQIVSASAHLKQHGVVHCDMKANNVMVDEDTIVGGRCPRIVLVDFGCAVILGEQLDESWNLHRNGLGNMAHLAPEVHLAMQKDPLCIPLLRQGAFSTGILLFELAMGLEQPLHEYPNGGTLSPDAFGTIDWSGLRRHVGPQYAQVVRGLMAFDPNRRLTLNEARRQLQALTGR